MMRPRYLVVLTWVRPGVRRDEVDRPERTVEAVAVFDRASADRLFGAMCALPLVRRGRQRAKVVDLLGEVTAGTRAALVRIGARRRRSWV